MMIPGDFHRGMNTVMDQVQRLYIVHLLTSVMVYDFDVYDVCIFVQCALQVDAPGQLFAGASVLMRV